MKHYKAESQRHTGVHLHAVCLEGARPCEHWLATFSPTGNICSMLLTVLSFHISAFGCLYHLINS